MATSVNRPHIVTQPGRAIRLKNCTRCGGDTCQGRDIYGEFNTCFQCGHTTDMISRERVAAMMAASGMDVVEVA